MNEKIVHVAAAAIHKDEKLFVAQRGYGEFKGGWEFPGGKIEAGESSKDAIIREIDEEFSVPIIVEGQIGTFEYDYPNFHLIMDLFLCSLRNNKLTLNEHLDSKWINASEIDNVDWLPADRLAIQSVMRRLTA